MTESQVPLLETDTVGGIEAALLTLKVLFPTLMVRNLKQQCWMDSVWSSPAPGSSVCTAGLWRCNLFWEPIPRKQE